MKKVKHIKTKLFSLAQLKHNESLKGNLEYAVFVHTALTLYNSRPRKIETQCDYFKFISEQSGLSYTYVKNKVYEAIRNGEAKWSNKKERKNYLCFTKQMIQPYKVIRKKAIKYKEERYEKLNIKKGENYKADSDMDCFVMLSQHFYEFMKKHGLTIRQAVLMFVLYNKRELTEKGNLSLIGLGDILCVSKPTIIAEIKVLVDKGLLLIKSGQITYEMNKMKIIDEVKAEIEDAITNGSTSQRKCGISAHTAYWFYQWYNIPSNRYIIGGYFDYKSKKYIKRQLTDEERGIKEQLENYRKKSEEKERLGLKYKRTNKRSSNDLNKCQKYPTYAYPNK